MKIGKIINTPEKGFFIGFGGGAARPAST